jgi:Zn-dependent protease
MLVITVISPTGHTLVRYLAEGGGFSLSQSGSDSIVVPASVFLYEVIYINVILAVFNLIPVPPLDGSHVLRHFLSDSARRAYDSMGMFLLIALIVFGGGLLSRLISPFLYFFDRILLSL